MKISKQKERKNRKTMRSSINNTTSKEIKKGKLKKCSSTILFNTIQAIIRIISLRKKNIRI